MSAIAPRQPQHEPDLDLEVAVQQRRRTEGHQCADHAACATARRRQPRGCGRLRAQLAVAIHAHDEQPGQEHADVPADVQHTSFLPQQRAHGQQRQQRRGAEDTREVPAVAIETEGEAQQVDHQRQHPHHRKRGDVLRQVVGQRHQCIAAERRQRKPAQRARPAGRRCAAVERAAGVGRRSRLTAHNASA